MYKINYLNGTTREFESLKGADLRGADLYEANLIRADLRGANLRRAYLRGANLRRAYLRGADLRRAYLRGANLRRAYLRGADLNRADLNGADLEGAALYGANLTGINHSETILMSITDFRWDIVVHNEKVVVGCQTHSYKEWLAFSDNEISDMDEYALAFYPDLIKILKIIFKD